jgi:hypothetical protein
VKAGCLGPQIVQAWPAAAVSRRVAHGEDMRRPPCEDERRGLAVVAAGPDRRRGLRRGDGSHKPDPSHPPRAAGGRSETNVAAVEGRGVWASPSDGRARDAEQRREVGEVIQHRRAVPGGTAVLLAVRPRPEVSLGGVANGGSCPERATSDSRGRATLGGASDRSS